LIILIILGEEYTWYFCYIWRVLEQLLFDWQYSLQDLDIDLSRPPLFQCTPLHCLLLALCKSNTELTYRLTILTVSHLFLYTRTLYAASRFTIRLSCRNSQPQFSWARTSRTFNSYREQEILCFSGRNEYTKGGRIRPKFREREPRAS
jgi:hypothetical protein